MGFVLQLCEMRDPHSPSQDFFFKKSFSRENFRIRTLILLRLGRDRRQESMTRSLFSRSLLLPKKKCSRMLKGEQCLWCYQKAKKTYLLGRFSIIYIFETWKESSIFCEASRELHLHSYWHRVSDFPISVCFSLNFPEKNNIQQRKNSSRQLGIILFYCLHKQFAI